MIKAKVTQKDILYLSISLFVVVAAWVGFNIYHTWVTTKISEEIQAQVLPINPTFDLETVQQLKGRQKIQPLNDIAVSSRSAITPTPTLEITDTASGSANPQSVGSSSGTTRQGQ